MAATTQPLSIQRAFITLTMQITSKQTKQYVTHLDVMTLIGRPLILTTGWRCHAYRFCGVVLIVDVSVDIVVSVLLATVVAAAAAAGAAVVIVVSLELCCAFRLGFRESVTSYQQGFSVLIYVHV